MRQDTDQQAVYWVASQVHIWSLQEAPIPAFVVRDVCLHLVIHLLVCQEYPFDTCYLGKKARDGEPCWGKMSIVWRSLGRNAPGLSTVCWSTQEEKGRSMVRNVIFHMVYRRSLSSFLLASTQSPHSLHPPPAANQIFHPPQTHLLCPTLHISVLCQRTLYLIDLFILN